MSSIKSTGSGVYISKHVIRGSADSAFPECFRFMHFAKTELRNSINVDSH